MGQPTRFLLPPALTSVDQSIGRHNWHWTFPQANIQSITPSSKCGLIPIGPEQHWKCQPRAPLPKQISFLGMGSEDFTKVHLPPSVICSRTWEQLISLEVVYRLLTWQKELNLPQVMLSFNMASHSRTQHFPASQAMATSSDIFWSNPDRLIAQHPTPQLRHRCSIVVPSPFLCPD